MHTKLEAMHTNIAQVITAPSSPSGVNASLSLPRTLTKLTSPMNSTWMHARPIAGVQIGDAQERSKRTKYRGAYGLAQRHDMTVELTMLHRRGNAHISSQRVTC
jgi:hypothetical protein